MIEFEGSQELLNYIFDNWLSRKKIRVWEILDIVNLPAMVGRDLLWGCKK